MFRNFGYALNLGTLLFLSSLCQADVWKIDSDHSSVHFKVKHMMVSNVNGELTGLKGFFDLDDKNIKKAEASVDVKGINTNNTKRDEHLKSPDFFDAKKYPTITFKSTSYEKAEGKMVLKGDLTMHGVTKPVSFDVEPLSDAVKDPWGNQRRGFSASTQVDRKDFGLKWNKVLEAGGVAVGEKVSVTIEAELIAEKAESKKSSKKS